MIVLHAAGGLGNQLFNYAAARSLADRCRTGCLIDAGSCQGSGVSRPFLLNAFPALRAQVRNAPGQASPPLLSRVGRRIREDVISKAVHRRYESVGWFPGFERLGRSTVLRGHFIDRRFFEWNEARIRADMALPDDFLSRRQDRIGEAALAALQGGEIPVSVHVRRGDFLAPHARWLLLPNVERYYRAAMERMTDLLSARLRFWVFSDDPPWCRQAFQAFPFQIDYVDRLVDTPDAMREFFLMSRCQHHIIANSSFSLWAARLRDKGKVVIAPFRWDAEGRTSLDTLIPSDWIRQEWDCSGG